MARCKLTSMNLRTIRKSREYQALLIDLVAMGVVGKSAAEGILGYTIPAGLLGSTVTDDDDTESGDESGGESGGESSNTVTLLYMNKTANDGAGAWETAEYDLSNGSSAIDMCTFAQSTFNNDLLNVVVPVEANPEYVEGETALNNKYIPLDPQPGTLESGMLVAVIHRSDTEDPEHM